MPLKKYSSSPPKVFSRNRPISSYHYGTSHSGSRVATIKYIPGGLMLEVEFPYDESLLADMNASVQSKKRVWNPSAKVWYIAKDQFDKISHILGKHCDEVLLLDFPAPEVATTAWAKLYLISGAPMEVVQAVYRALAKLNHPDYGGDEDRMKEINIAYKAILGEELTSKED